jgi:L-serine dehydratase
VVTAPTNRVAALVPAEMLQHTQFCGGVNPQAQRTFHLTAAAIGSLYKKLLQSQGLKLAGAGLFAVLGGGGGVEEIEIPAGIAMDDLLGMTCDPVGGLVQISCIQRNAMGAVKTINAAHLALVGDGRLVISLDRVIQTMRQTGADISHKYKETSLGGLVVCLDACKFLFINFFIVT